MPFSLQCSRTCGPGIKRRAVGCFSMITRRLVDESACDAKLRPAVQENCILKECVPEATWRKGEWGKVSIPYSLLQILEIFRAVFKLSIRRYAQMHWFFSSLRSVIVCCC